MESTKESIEEQLYNAAYNLALSDFIKAIGYEKGLPNILKNGTASEVMDALIKIQLKLAK